MEEGETVWEKGAEEREKKDWRGSERERESQEMLNENGEDEEREGGTIVSLCSR
jgi:hypothetical protein